jgi:hypothetical protein
VTFRTLDLNFFIYREELAYAYLASGVPPQAEKG